MSETALPKHEHLAKLDQEIVAAKARVNEVKAQRQHAKADAARIVEELIEACANADAGLEAKLTRAKGKAEARAAEPWAERITGAERVAARQQTERDRWVGEHFEQLIDELRPDADAAAAAIRDAADALEQSLENWGRVDQQVANLMRAAGRNMDSQPRLDAVQQVVRTMVRDMPPIESPLPKTGTVPAWSFAPGHEPPDWPRMTDPKAKAGGRA